MSETGQTLDQRRNRNYEETHRQLVERAVALIGREGVEALTVATLAHDTGMNRSTVYYHFDSRETLLIAAKKWFGARLSEMMVAPGDSQAWLEKAVQFGLENPQLMHEWVMDLVNHAPITRNFPRWDDLVELASRSPQVARVEEGKGGPGAVAPLDARVWATVLLASVLMAPRLFRVAVQPDPDVGEVARHYALVLRRMLQSSLRGAR
jgi:AcrR family transcriptional regulator